MPAAVGVFSTDVVDLNLSPAASGTETAHLPLTPRERECAPLLTWDAQATAVTLFGEHRERTDWYVSALQKLSRMSALENDWDSYGAEPPNDIAICLIRNILDVLVEDDFQPTNLDASSEGGVCLSFQRADRYADIECFNSGEALAVVSKCGKDTEVWELANLDGSLTSTLNRIRLFLEKGAQH